MSHGIHFRLVLEETTGRTSEHPGRCTAKRANITRAGSSNEVTKSELARERQPAGTGGCKSAHFHRRRLPHAFSRPLTAARGHCGSRRSRNSRKRISHASSTSSLPECPGREHHRAIEERGDPRSRPLGTSRRRGVRDAGMGRLVQSSPAARVHRLRTAGRTGAGLLSPCRKVGHRGPT